MAESTGKDKGAGNPPAASQKGGGLFTLIHVAVVVALIACIVAMYQQNMELSYQLGEARAAATLKAKAPAAAPEAKEEGLSFAERLDELAALVRQEASRTVESVKESNQGIVGLLSAAQKKVDEMMQKGDEFVKKLKKNPMLSSFIS